MMKVLFYVIIFWLIFLQPFQKITMTATNKSSITGNWELRQRSGGNILPASFSSGNGNLLRLTDSTYTLYEKGSLLVVGCFKMQTNSKSQTIIVYDDDPASSDELVVRDDTLILKPTHPDFATRIYVRIH
jgi:hypothetical protein